MKRTALLLAVTVCGAGCMSVTSKIPGVLDLRSDGADAPVNSEPLPPSATRAGFDGFAFGEGVKGGADVLIEDRSHLLLNLVTVGNASSTEEWQAALGGQAMRNVTITEQESVMAWVVSTLKGCTGILGIVQGTWDFRARGTRIQIGASTRDESIPPPPAAELAPPAATVSPATGY